MKVRIRAKAGGRLIVSDDRGRPIDGLVATTLSCVAGEKPVVTLTIKAPIVAIDDDAAQIDHGKAPVEKSAK